MRRYFALALILVAAISASAWLLVVALRPLIAANLNNGLVLFFIALTSTIGILAGFKDVVELLQLLTRPARSTETNSVPTTTKPLIQYTSQLEPQLEVARTALEAIQAIGLESSLDKLVITHDLSLGGWIGSDSEFLIDTLHSIMTPIAMLELISYPANRNYALLNYRSRIQFSLLEAARNALLSDQLIAGLEPSIEYSPRVPRWRLRRIENPQKYWWQGLSEDRLDEAIPNFLITDPASGQRRIMTGREFRDHYLDVFRGHDPDAHRQLGLAANALFGFVPKTRPVYWRLLIIQARIYRAMLRSESFSDKDLATADQFKKLFASTARGEFPYTEGPPASTLHEPYKTTLRVSTLYLEKFEIPKLLIKIRAPQESL